VPAPHLLLLSAFAGLLLGAAFTDIRRFEIPNPIPIILAVLYPLFALVSPGPAHALTSLAVAAASLALGAALFATGMVGGGDVKLFAAASLWINPADCVAFVVLTAFLGGLLALILLTGPGHFVFDRLSTVPVGNAGSFPRLRRPMPYGVAISAAALTLMIPNFLS